MIWLLYYSYLKSRIISYLYIFMQYRTTDYSIGVLLPKYPGLKYPGIVIIIITLFLFSDLNLYILLFIFLSVFGFFFVYHLCTLFNVQCTIYKVRRVFCVYKQKQTCYKYSDKGDKDEDNKTRRQEQKQKRDKWTSKSMYINVCIMYNTYVSKTILLYKQ